MPASLRWRLQLACSTTVAAAVLVCAVSCARMPTSPLAPAAESSHAPAPSSGGGGGGGGGNDGPEIIGGQVVVTLVAGASAGAVAADHSATLLEYEPAERTAVYAPAAGQTTAELLAALLTDPRVTTCEDNQVLESAEARQQSFAFDDGAGSVQSYLEQPAAASIRLLQAHQVADGEGVLVAILDTGVDVHHPALRTVIAGGIDFVGNDDDASDVGDGADNDNDGRVDEAFGHGTHVAGIVRMVAPGAKLLAVRVLDADGRGDVLKVAAGVRWAVAHGAKVINLSLGTLGSSDALQNALEQAEDAGVSVVSAAGNWGADKPVEFPAKSSHVAAIAAVDTGATPAPFTSYGNLVALCAPGVGVRSTYPGGGYRLWSGTSMAAPFVAGTMALLAQSHPGWGLTQMLDRLSLTARPVSGGSYDYGAGMLDAGAALAPDRRSHVDDVPPAETIRPR